MDSGNVSFEESFARRLPLELKQMVFKWAVMGTSNDVEIKSDRDNIVSPEPSALNFLAKLKGSYSYDVYKEAMEYLTKPMFRWVFTSDSEPHRYLLETFHKQAPRELRERIQHVYWRRIRAASLVNLMEFTPGLQHRWNLAFPIQPDYSMYSRMCEKGLPVMPSVFSASLIGIEEGMALLPQTFPSIKKLDIGLDLYDCTFVSCTNPFLALFGNLILRDRQFTILYALLPLRDLNNISNVDIRVFWGNYFGQDDDIHGGKGKGKIKEMQESIVQKLREVVPAHCITCHDSDDIRMHSPSEC